MKEKIKEYLSFFLCAALGAAHFILLAFPCVKVYASMEGVFSRMRMSEVVSGYRMMGMGYADEFNMKAEAFGVIGGVVQILVMLVAAAMLAIGILGILKCFGAAEVLPDQVSGYDTKTLVGFVPALYLVVNILLCIVLLIVSIANMNWDDGYREGVALARGFFWILIFAAATTSYTAVLPLLKGALSTNGAPRMEYICGNCGKKSKKTNKFCNVCGGEIVAREKVVVVPDAPAPVVVKNVCPNCGKEIAAGQRFCTGCGTSV